MPDAPPRGLLVVDNLNVWSVYILKYKGKVNYRETQKIMFRPGADSVFTVINSSRFMFVKFFKESGYIKRRQHYHAHESRNQYEPWGKTQI
jgi:hypothetical protein